MADQVPPDWQDKVMHGSRDDRRAGADGRRRRAATATSSRKGFSLSIADRRYTSDAERILRDLAQGGRILTLPLEPTFWAARFGMVVDRFGIPWTINCDGGRK